MGAMGMTFTGPVTIASTDAGTRTVTIKANTRETLGQSYATGDITISVGDGGGPINAIANVGGKAAGMGEGVIVNVLIHYVVGNHDHHLVSLARDERRLREVLGEAAPAASGVAAATQLLRSLCPPMSSRRTRRASSTGRCSCTAITSRPTAGRRITG